MIPDCDRQTVGQTESIIAKTVLCIASYADALSIKSFIKYTPLNTHDICFPKTSQGDPLQAFLYLTF